MVGSWAQETADRLISKGNHPITMDRTEAVQLLAEYLQKI